jgi:16S rRNA (cytosine967-C5)-methyltransferase
MKQWSYVNSAAQILSIYKGEEPFASFLKKYFREHKKFGSKDRKQISHLCYCYFRLGQSALPFSVEERILVGLFFCSHGFNEVLEALKPEWNREVSLSLREKCSMLNVQWSMLNVFPWKDELSKGIEHEKFTASFFIQPDLFLRLRPGKESVVQQKLKNAGIEFRLLKEDSVALTNAAKLDEVIEMNKEAVVQDFSSQSVVRSLTSSSDGELIEPPVRRGRQTVLRRQAAKVWDCCAASGGKSIMVYDLDPTIELTVSDVRESILINLRKRFEEAGIRKYRSFIADLSAPGFKQSTHFDLVICDAPCTGSGTWSRTPEQLYYFDENKIEKYASLQKRIVTNIIPSIREEGYLLYITCSVFKKENEEVVQFIQDNFAFELIEANTIKGYEIKADTMFAALFKKRKQPGDDLV